jgi:hypothetical protein
VDTRTGRAGLEAARVHGLADAFAAVPDPRGRWPPLVAILLIAACAVSSDLDGPTAIWQWVDDADEQVLARLGCAGDPWSGRRIPPSERTILRVPSLLDPQAVQDAAGWPAERGGSGQAAAAGTGAARRRAPGPVPPGPRTAASASTARACVVRIRDGQRRFADSYARSGALVAGK